MNNLNIIERGLAVLAPQWAARRIGARFAIEEMARAYDAAKKTNQTGGWITHGTSANAEVGPAIFNLRNRSRDLVRNSPWGSKAARIIQSNVVGKGITPYLPGGTKAEKNLIMDQWESFSDNCDPEGQMDFYGLESLVMRTVFESGECLIRIRKRPSKWNMDIPVQLEVLEPDFIDEGKNEVRKNGNIVILGREFDRYGRRMAYWLYPQHPGDSLVNYRTSFVARRVDAREVISVFDKVRPGQVSGVPWMAPVALKTRDVEDYDAAELIRKKIEACFVAFVKSANPGGHGGFAGGGDKDDKGDLIERVSPGRVYRTGYDQDVTFGSPNSVPGYADYIGVQLHAIAAGIGISYEQLTGNLSDVNYGSLRGGKVEFWATLDVWQHHMMVPQLCKRVWNEVNQVAVFLGRRPEGYHPAKWTAPVRPWIDPRKDADGQEALIKAGIETLPRVISDRGEDPEKHFDEIAASNKMLDDRGIIVTSDARQKMRGGDKMSDKKTKKDNKNA